MLKMVPPGDRPFFSCLDSSSCKIMEGSLLITHVLIEQTSGQTARFSGAKNGHFWHENAPRTLDPKCKKGTDLAVPFLLRSSRQTVDYFPAGFFFVDTLAGAAFGGVVLAGTAAELGRLLVRIPHTDSN